MPVYSLLAFRSTWGQLLDTANPVSNLLSHHGRSGWHEESYLLLKLHSTIHAAFLLLACKSTRGHLLASVTRRYPLFSHYLALQVNMRTFTCQCHVGIPPSLAACIASQDEDVYLPVPCSIPLLSHYWHASRHEDSYLPMPGGGSAPCPPMTAGTGSGSQHEHINFT